MSAEGIIKEIKVNVKYLHDMTGYGIMSADRIAAETNMEGTMRELNIKGKQIGAGRPFVCVPVMEEDAEEIKRQISELCESRADVIEWRVDAFGAYRDCNAVRAVLESIGPMLKEKLFLYTFRSKLQGGMGDAEGGLLRDLQELAAESGCVDLIDVEFFAEKSPASAIRRLQNAGVYVLSSHHDFLETPEPGVMKMLLERMRDGGADIVKLAVMPKNHQDVLNLLAVTASFAEENPDTPIVTMSMGKLGSISRLCGESFGSCMSFGVFKKASAPGQYGMEELTGILDLIHQSGVSGED